MDASDSELCAMLEAELEAHLERWPGERLLHRHANIVASMDGQRVELRARVWFDTYDERAQTVLRPAIRELFKRLGQQHQLRLAILGIDDPAGVAIHDYVQCGGDMHMIFMGPG